MKLLALKTALVMIATLMFASPIFAAPVDYTWSGTTGTVDVSTNWTPNGIPGTIDPETGGDTITIDNGGTAQVDATHTFGSYPLGMINVGSASGEGHFTQDGSAITLTGGSLYVGDSTTGLSSYALNSGTLTVPGWSAVGNGTTGTMTIGQTGSTETATFYSNCNWFVGFSNGGNGTMTMSGAAEAYTGSGFMVGRNYGGTCSGTMTMNDNAKLWSPYATRGNGNFTFNVGCGEGSTGTMTMNDDTMADIDNWDAFVGCHGATGTLTMNNNAQMTINTISEVEGENTYNGLAQVGAGFGGTTGGNGTINLNNHSSLAYDTALAVLVGAWGSNDATASTGTINVSGGTDYTTDPGASFSSINAVTIGVGTNGYGNLNVHDYGSLTVDTNAGLDLAAYLGTTNALVDGHGTLSAGYINLGSQFGSNGLLTLRDNATVNVTNGPGYFTMNVGTWQGHGELVIEDNATVNVTGQLLIGNQGVDTQTSTGTLTMSGGTINAGNIYMGIGGYASATVNMTGGSMISTGATGLARGSATDNSATLHMSGNASWSSTNSWVAVGNGYGGNGYGECWTCDQATISAAGDLLVAYGGIGTLHIGDGTATDSVVVSTGTGVLLGNSSPDAQATINLNAGGTLETPKFFTGGALSSVINFNGGTLKATGSDVPEIPGDPPTPAVMFLSNDGGSTTFELNVMAGGAIIDTNGNTDTITESLLSGEAEDGGLTKLGAGELILTAATHTYTGHTVVEAGTLSTTSNTTFSDTGKMKIASGAVLNLDFTGIADTVMGLYLDGVAQALGTWGSSTSGATYQNDTYFSGTGTILVVASNEVPGDTNGDKIVDETDAAVVAGNWGETDITGGPAEGDFNEDGVVDATDASIMAGNWGNHNTGTDEGNSVPEPSTIMLLLAGIIMVVARRR